MSGYRFCRTDDIPLLVDAHNRCCAAHPGGEPPMTVADFRRGARELDLWASSCMVAFAGSEPIGVLLSGKRETESIIHRIGVRPGHLRQGHGRHLLGSLGRKLAILGPKRIVAEIPADAAGTRAFFESCGYREETRFVDFVRAVAPAALDAGDLAVPVTLAEIVDAGAWHDAVPRSWRRSLPALAKRPEPLEGLAIVSDVRPEAWLLHGPRLDGDGREVMALGSAGGDRGEPLLGALVNQLARSRPGPVTIPRVAAGEVRPEALSAWGFRATAEYVGYALTAGGCA